jgi:hypothetical protein
LEYRLFLCRPELVSVALAQDGQGGMTPAEVLAWISRQLALVGVGVDNLLERARRALPPPSPLAAAETPRLALPAEPCVQALDALLDVARGWLEPPEQQEAGEWPGGAPTATAFPESAYELCWSHAQARHTHSCRLLSHFSTQI